MKVLTFLLPCFTAIIGLMTNVTEAIIIGGAFSSRITMNQGSIVTTTYGTGLADFPVLDKRASYFINLPIPSKGKWSHPNCVLIENDSEDRSSDIAIYPVSSSISKHDNFIRIEGSFKLKAPLKQAPFTITCSVKAPQELPRVTKNNAGGEVRFSNNESAISVGKISLSSVTYTSYSKDTEAYSSGDLESSGKTEGTLIKFKNIGTSAATFTISSPELIFALAQGDAHTCDIILDKNKDAVVVDINATSTQSATLTLTTPIPKSDKMIVHCKTLLLKKVTPAIPSVLSIVVADSTEHSANEFRSAVQIEMDNSAQMYSIAMMSAVTFVAVFASIF